MSSSTLGEDVVERRPAGLGLVGHVTVKLKDRTLYPLRKPSINFFGIFFDIEAQLKME